MLCWPRATARRGWGRGEGGEERWGGRRRAATDAWNASVILLTDFDVATRHKVSDKSGAYDEMMSGFGLVERVCGTRPRYGLGPTA